MKSPRAPGQTQAQKDAERMQRAEQRRLKEKEAAAMEARKRARGGRTLLDLGTPERRA